MNKRNTQFIIIAIVVILVAIIGFVLFGLPKGQQASIAEIPQSFTPGDGVSIVE